MAIYPVIKGQKLDQRNVIPPHNAEPTASHQPPKTDQPKEVKPQDDLIDFGQNEAPQPAQSAQPAQPVQPVQPVQPPQSAQPVPSTQPVQSAQPAAAPSPPTSSEPPKTHNVITHMLNATGRPAEGPLIDFTKDLKQDLPPQTHK